MLALGVASQASLLFESGRFVPRPQKREVRRAFVHNAAHLTRLTL